MLVRNVIEKEKSSSFRKKVGERLHNFVVEKVLLNGHRKC